MAWAAQNVTVWRFCWKWGFIPYPCRKIVTKLCCSGPHKWRVWGAFVRENYVCCDGNESHWFDAGWFVGAPIWHLVQQVQVCRSSQPSETEGCGNFVGDFPTGDDPVG
jgi:hypothetical protein